MNEKMNTYLEKLQSLLENKNTNWDVILGEFAQLVNKNWDSNEETWVLGSNFTMLFFPVAYVLAEDEVKKNIEYYISMVDMYGSVKEMEG
tara:strand:- start:8351 stop:8620 length:270 start_codon:yes stop_codon:yes gene_type:complete